MGAWRIDPDRYTHEAEHARELGHGMQRRDIYTDTGKQITCECRFSTDRALLSMVMQQWREHAIAKIGQQGKR